MEEKKGKKGMCRVGSSCSGGGLIWALGVVGSAIYYIQVADSFGAGFFGLLKALVWPAVLVYQLLGFLAL